MCTNRSEFAKNGFGKRRGNFTSELEHLEIELILSKILDRLDELEEKIDDLHGDLLDHILDESFEYEDYEDDEDEDDHECNCKCN